MYDDITITAGGVPLVRFPDGITGLTVAPAPGFFGALYSPGEGILTVIGAPDKEGKWPVAIVDTPSRPDGRDGWRPYCIEQHTRREDVTFSPDELKAIRRLGDLGAVLPPRKGRNYSLLAIFGSCHMAVSFHPNFMMAYSRERGAAWADFSGIDWESDDGPKKADRWKFGGVGWYKDGAAMADKIAALMAPRPAAIPFTPPIPPTPAA